MLDAFIPRPRLTELEHVDVAVPAAKAYEAARHLDLSRSPLVRALFALRTIPARVRGRDQGPLRLAIDDITGAGSAFAMLADEPDAFGRFAERGWGRVAWSIVVEPRGAGASRVTVELRVDATDDDAWRAVHRYFAVIGPFSRFIRRQMLRRKIPPLRVVEVEDGRWAVALGGGVAGDPACSSGSKSAPSTPRIGRDVR